MEAIFVIFLVVLFGAAIVTVVGMSIWYICYAIFAILRCAVREQ